MAPARASRVCRASQAGFPTASCQPMPSWRNLSRITTVPEIHFSRSAVQPLSGASEFQAIRGARHRPVPGFAKENAGGTFPDHAAEHSMSTKLAGEIGPRAVSLAASPTLFVFRKRLRHRGPSPPACRCRRSRPPWATPTYRPPRSTSPPRASRRGIFWPGCGPRSRIRSDPASEGLLRLFATRMLRNDTDIRRTQPVKMPQACGFEVRRPIGQTGQRYRKWPATLVRDPDSWYRVRHYVNFASPAVSS